MKIEQIYTGCLAHGAYYIESNGEAAIIDPLRETQPYLDRAAKDGAKYKYILETHFHADFVSGHLDLARKTGAKIVYGPTAQPGFEAHVAADNEDLKLGNIAIRVLHTPGHTMESSCFLLLDENGKMHSIFTGDTVFIGDVGRPDLAVKTDLSREDLAGHLYHSIHTKILPLPDDIIIYPGHGAGSACGKNMSDETQDTLGNQRKLNYALRADMSREEFIAEVTAGLTKPPQYFPKNAVMNKMGYDSFDAVMEKGTVAMDADRFEATIREHVALVIDTRSVHAFGAAHISGSVYIGIDGQFANWVGSLITDLKQPIVFVADPGREEEVVMRLSRVGYDNALGYLAGGLAAWTAAGKPVSHIDSISAPAFAERYRQQPLHVVDVRREGEYMPKHVKCAVNVPLDYLNDNMGVLHKDTTYTLHCAGGYRSMIAASILQARGYSVVNVEGGFKEISAQDIPMVSEAVEA
jgi:glyoxylase-like metal-dependent hydrolase (beta-lactamase superfamily II)/rhodanese-related sulfurtransferase